MTAPRRGAGGTTVANWGRSASARPAEIVHARSVDDVVLAVRQAQERGLPVKAIGAGHSFTDAALTDGVLLDVSAIDGVLAVDARGRVALGAGTNLYQLPALLAPHGLALANMGDIDRQTIAGATSTGTHGTGARYGGLATQLTAVTLVTASGELLRVSETEHAELLPAVRLGIGALGVLVEVEVQCVPAYLLHAVERPEPFEDVLDGFLETAAANDHYEGYWWPSTTTISTKTNTRLPADTPYRPLSALADWWEDEAMGSGALWLISALGLAVPAVTPRINRIVAAVYGNREFTAPSHEVFTSPRRVRFKEMEYALPAEALPAAVRELRRVIEERGWRISFPVELRVAAADENWLSTAYGRSSAYVAVHRYHREDHSEYFAAAEAIFRAHDGRPHWGKLHTRTAADLAPAYPRFGDFLAVRDRLDPTRVFANAFTRRVLGD